MFNLRSSELWITIAVILGQALVAFKVIDGPTWENVLFPAIVYIIGRVVSKVVKLIPEKPEA